MKVLFIIVAIISFIVCFGEIATLRSEVAILNTEVESLSSSVRTLSETQKTSTDSIDVLSKWLKSLSSDYTQSMGQVVQALENNTRSIVSVARHEGMVQ